MEVMQGMDLNNNSSIGNSNGEYAFAASSDRGESSENLLSSSSSSPEEMEDEAKLYLTLLLQKESELYRPVPEDYLSRADCGPSPGSGDAWRRKLSEWCYEVVDHFNFDREVVSYAMSFLDRTVAALTTTGAFDADAKIQEQQGPPPQEPVSKRKIQLIAVTALMMAIKIHGETDDLEGPRRKLRIGTFVTLSHGFFTVETIEAMERKMLELLKWNVNPPTSLRFINSYLALCPEWDSPDEEQPRQQYATAMRNITDVARYLSELSVCVSSFSSEHCTSVTAYASIVCALEALKDPLPARIRSAFLGNVAASTGIHHSSAHVRLAMAKLKGLCPSIFAKGDGEQQASSSAAAAGNNAGNVSLDTSSRGPTDKNALHISNAGTTSPVSVAVVECDGNLVSSSSPHQQQQHQQGAEVTPGGSTRKRGRSAGDYEHEEVEQPLTHRQRPSPPADNHRHLHNNFERNSE